MTAVLEALGKKAGPEDDRSTPQRFHDALQLACELLLRARLVPDRAGADTQVTANISLRDLRAMPGASGLEDVWVRALLGEGGYLTGDDAQAAACDAMIVPVVAGKLNSTVLDQMINLVLGAFGHNPDREAHRDQAERLSAAAAAAFEAPSPSAASAFSGGGPGPAEMSPQAWQALRYALAKLAVDLVSGPLPLDIGYSETIPASIRRAVNWRDRYKCAWPRCGRPAAWCDVHHIKHKKDGGKTSVDSCVTLCHFHQDICIHRWGWRITLNPDGSVSVYGPDGQVQHSHSPPTPPARAG